MNISHRVAALEESTTLAVSNLAARMRAEGIDVVVMAAGEPDFETPDFVKQAAWDALRKGQTRYAKPAHGIPEAKKAVCEKLRNENGLSYNPDQVIITVGGKEALFLAFMTLVNEGDEVIIPSPYWVSYPEQVKLCHGRNIFIKGPESNSFCITPDQLASALTDRTRIVVLNYPSNPGGFTYAPQALREIAEVLRGRDLIVFSDEMYDRLLYGGREFLSFAAIDEEMYEKTLTINAASKTYAMTGWRVGYAAGPRWIIDGMARLQSQTTSGAATFIQHALAAALTGDQSEVEHNRREYEKRAGYLYNRLNALPGVTCVEPTGAFYCFPNVSGTYKKLGVGSSAEFATKVLREARVAVVPGGAFGCDENVRLSFAIDADRIKEGMDRLEALLRK